MKITLNRTQPLFITMLALLALFLFSAGLALANGHFSMLASFTQTELDTSWQADRTFPTGGVDSVTAFGRDNVAQISIDSSNPHPVAFHRTEGITTVGTQDFGTAVEVDLYVDPAWENQATRAGYWVVGDNGAGGWDNWFGILEFVNLEPSLTGNSSQGDHEGWRFWSSADGWTNLAADFTYGEWATLGIKLDTTTQMYSFFIDGARVGSGPGGENFINDIFLNSYNYGLDTFPNLGNGDFIANWHAGYSLDDCKDGGF